MRRVAPTGSVQHSGVQAVREGIIRRFLIAGFSLTCVMLLLLYIILKLYGETDTQPPISIPPVRPRTRPQFNTLPPIVRTLAPRTLDPKACDWTKSDGEIMAMLQFEPPLWVALPAQDKRFAEAASVAREGVVLDLAVESESVFSPSLLASFPPGSVFIDVGADIGLFALQLAAFTCPATDVTSLNGKPCQPGEGRFTVVAFEPRQESAQHMRSAAARNCFTNMITSMTAVWSRKGTAELRVPRPPNSHASSLHPRMAPHLRVPALQVQTTSLDEWLRDQQIALEHVRFIKVDIPCSALQILRGAFYALRKPPTLYLLLTIDVTLMKNLRESPMELLALISAAGLTPHFDNQSWNSSQWAQLISLLRVRGESVLHCIKSKSEEHLDEQLGGYRIAA